jgi:hypothetical protein
MRSGDQETSIRNKSRRIAVIRQQRAAGLFPIGPASERLTNVVLVAREWGGVSNSLTIMAPDPVHLVVIGSRGNGLPKV